MHSLLANTPPILKEEIQAYQKLQKQSDRELRDLILDAGANKYLRMAAAEKIEDVPMILDILRTGLQGYNWKDKYTPEETLIWQLQEGPEGGLFESVAKDPGYDIKIREEIIARIWDMETLERLSEFPELSAACTKQRQEATCINGHQWELEREELRMYDENDWGSIRWRIRHYRCARCGATMEGPREQC